MASRRQLVLEAIRRHFRELGQSPSHGEIAQATGLQRQHVGQWLEKLQKQGVLSFERGRARSIRLTDRSAMFSDSEIELLCISRGWAITKPALPLADHFPVDSTVPEFGLPLLDRLSDIA